jgi:hypothetical protein
LFQDEGAIHEGEEKRKKKEVRVTSIFFTVFSLGTDGSWTRTHNQGILKGEVSLYH